MIFVLGLALCLSVRRTGTLWWAVGWHAAFDFAQFYLMGTRNGGQEPVAHLFNTSFPGPAWITGGELGTEASVFVVPAAIATFVYAGWLMRRRPSSALVFLLLLMPFAFVRAGERPCCPQPATNKEAVLWHKLEAEIHTIDEHLDGVIAVAIEDLTTGHTLFLNPD